MPWETGCALQSAARTILTTFRPGHEEFNMVVLPIVAYWAMAGQMGNGDAHWAMPAPKLDFFEREKEECLQCQSIFRKGGMPKKWSLC